MRLLERLEAIQARGGAVTDADLQALARDTGTPLYHLEGLRSFYPVFREAPGPVHRVQVCRDAVCRLAGAEPAVAALEAAFAGRDDVALERVSCLGLCDCAPAASLDEAPGALPAPERLSAWLDGGERPPAATAAGGPLPTDPYAGRHEHYATAARWQDADPEAVIRALDEAGLQGLGGAAFPTARKWAFTRAAQGAPRTVICNADESEPGTFKDRLILEAAPHLVIEGMVMGARVIGAGHGIIYLRHEYQRARESIAAALADARGRGLLGEGFDIELFVSPGGYILGEETALLEALEDRRGEPRNKPPFPTNVGLHGGPTLINNVETLAAVTTILAHGPEWWRAQGRGGYSGLKYVSVSGDVVTPGVHCLPWGTPVREAIERCGGVMEGRGVLAFSPGGASTPFLPGSLLDTPLAFETLREAGSGLGTGALVVVAEGRDLADVLLAQARFFRNESCGKCVPCRVGSRKGVALAEAAAAGEVAPGVAEALRTLHGTLARTSICGLGQVALLPVVDALERFADEPSVQRLRGEVPWATSP
ncbi:NADH-ubiquinone oxidoreductase-F iron-sulfur binding region domain-containing protein [Spiribacter halobius]|uniref:NADH-quinone oxidoreductase subunit F n=2 Tax=Sediminicurvatus halobius TaxID=2182432 RepID=A0A2U2MVQ7_9GAMM|nr:NADH-ubiquinone oxidoreductase-F iron-sulfur binding region domain-containing protein [Spiribacter halobius]PWG60912.1 nitroreductase family protein [Spiribacter halobius]UEX77301.1 NAD(P)H-dependent oxidoreductase subunit E [Spiribacter halobius]